jgi:hypothetical protein
VRTPPTTHTDLCRAILADVVNGIDIDQVQATTMQTQCYLRHAMAETISEGIINCLIITNSSDANVQLTRIHEHIFARKLDFPHLCISLIEPAFRRPNSSMRMAATNIFCSRGVMHPRNVAQHPIRTNAGTNETAEWRTPYFRRHLNSGIRIRVLADASWFKFQLRGRILSSLCPRTGKHTVPSTDRTG